MAEGKKIGRPTKPAKAGERASLGLRVTAELKQRLDAAAAVSGRSQSQEAEFRLERSFAEDRYLTSEAIRAWAYLIASEFAKAGTFEANMQDSGRTWSDAEWLADPLAYRSAMFSAMRKLIRDMPKPNREDVQMTLEDIARQFQRLEGELLGTNTLVSGFIDPATEKRDGTR